jgi:hypothetical protein
MAHLLTITGEYKEVRPKDRETGFDLEELYELLSCRTVEMVMLAKGQHTPYVAMLMDENGKLDGKETNIEATRIRARTFDRTPEQLIYTGDHIVGDVLLVTNKEFQ